MFDPQPTLHLKLLLLQCKIKQIGISRNSYGNSFG